MKRYLISFFIAVVFCLNYCSCLFSFSAPDFTYSEPFNYFTLNLHSYYSSHLDDYNHKFWILYACPYSKDYNTFLDNRYYTFYLFTVYDVTEDDKFYFPTDSNTYFPYSKNFTTSDDVLHRYNWNVWGFGQCDLSSGSVFTSSSYSTGNQNLNYPLILDYLNSDLEFPFYASGSPPAYKPTGTIIASNCDIYDFSGNLLQIGNYDRLCDIVPILGNYAENLSTYEPPTEPPTYTGYEQEQASNSRTIIGKLSDVWNSISALPSAIAQNIGGFFDSLGDRISGFFDTLLDGILIGLQSLFVPSDNLFIDLMDLLHSKFAFIFQIFEITDFIVHRDWSGQTPPEFNISLPQSWGGQTLTTFDSNFWFVLSAQWRSFIQNFVSGILIFFAVRKLKKRLPDIINGVSSHEGGDS